MADPKRRNAPALASHQRRGGPHDTSPTRAEEERAAIEEQWTVPRADEAIVDDPLLYPERHPDAGTILCGNCAQRYFIPDCPGCGAVHMGVHPDADLVALAERMEALERKALTESEHTRSEGRANFCAGQAHASGTWAEALRVIIAKREARSGE